MGKKRILILTFLITFVIFIGVIYVLYLQKKAEENIFFNLNEIVKQDSEKLKIEIEDHENILQIISNEVINYKITNKNEIFKIFEKNPGHIKFTRMAIMDKEGNLFTNDGKKLDFSEEKETFFASNEIQITEPRKSKINQDTINMYSKKVEVKGEEFILILVLETANYKEIFSQRLFEGRGHSYLENEKGEIITTSNPNLTKEIEEEIEAVIPKQDVPKFYLQLQQLRKELKENKKANMIIKTIEGKYYVSCRNVGIHDWNIISVVPGHIIANGINKILLITTIVVFVAVIFVIFISIYIVKNNMKNEEKLYNLAYIDQLTKIGNVNYFKQCGNEELKNIENKYLIILDVDKFRAINEHYGIKLGDKMLVSIANILKKYSNCTSRISNDVFVTIIKTENINRQIEEIIKKTEKIIIDEKEYKNQVCIGCYPIEEKEDIMKCLDKALIAHKKAKIDSANKYCIYDEKLKEELLEEHKIVNNMEEALKNEEFKVYYQAKYNTKTKKIYGAEALVRWESNGEIIPPSKFIGIFEQNRFIIKLDLFVFESVCKDLKKLIDKGKEVPIISINISREHFITENFIQKYIQISEKYGINRNKIELEITERAASSNKYNIVEITNILKKTGFLISIDDFGTGYSSLNMLQDMNIDVIKIDKSFTDKINENETKMIEIIMDIAKKLKLETIAEGVENEKQIDILEKLGCYNMQGYYYAKPMKSEDFWKKYG